MVAVKRFPTSLPSCMKKFTSAETKEKPPKRSAKTDSSRPYSPRPDSARTDSNSALDQPLSVRSLPADQEYNLRLACTSILKTHKSHGRHGSQVVQADAARNSYYPADAGHISSHPDGLQARPDGDKSFHTDMKVPQGPPLPHAPRSRAQSRVDDLMGPQIRSDGEKAFLPATKMTPGPPPPLPHALRSRAQSRVDDLMGQPVHVQQE